MKSSMKKILKKMRKERGEPIKPKREQLGGFSPSEFKSFLKHLGHKIPRDFFNQASISQYKNRKYRWRWWGDSYTNDKTFVVDISCVNRDFDRWATSVEDCITFEEYVKAQKNKRMKCYLDKNLNSKNKNKMVNKV